MYSYLLILLSIFTFMSTPVFAADNDSKTPTSITVNKGGIPPEDYEIVKTNFETVGVTFTKTDDKIDILIDQTKLFAEVPSLIAQNILTKDDEKAIKISPMSMTVHALSIPYTVTILSAVYAKNTTLNKSSITTYIIPVGSSEKKPCYSFNYTRKMWEKLDMNKITALDFIRNTKGFEFSKWCRTILEKEDQEHAARSKSKK